MIDRSVRHRGFARRLLEVMGLPSLAGAALVGSACGGKVVVDANGGAGGAGGAGGGTTTTSTTTSTTTTSTSSSSSSSSGGGVVCTSPLIDGASFVCLSGPGTSCPPADAASHALAGELGLCDAVEDFTSCCDLPSLTQVVCGPDANLFGEACCYYYFMDPQMICGVGRPFVIEGRARTADLRPRADWCAELRPARGDLDPVTRGALAESWAREARFEHASVASFARLLLELLAVGAPMELVRDAQRAMADEIRHAELCFALASGYAGEDVGPGAIPMDGAVGRASLAAIAAAAVREGCIGETVAALVAEEARAEARDPAVRAALDVIAADEAEHAAMAWRLAAWAYREGPADVREAIAAAFAAPAAAPDDAAPVGIDVAAFRAHGRPLPADVRAVAASALAEVIQPSAAALLASVVVS